MFGPCRAVARALDAPLRVGRAAEGGLPLLNDKVNREHCIAGGGLTLFLRSWLPRQECGTRVVTAVHGVDSDGDSDSVMP